MPDGLLPPLAAPGGPPAAPPVAPPLGASPAQAPPQAGVRAQARVKVSLAVKQLVDALGLLREAGSDEARAILQALKVLGPITPEVDEGVSQSEIRALVSGRLPVGPGPATPLGTPRPVPRPITSILPM
jgi:hypothetical protein